VDLSFNPLDIPNGWHPTVLVLNVFFLGMVTYNRWFFHKVTPSAQECVALDSDTLVSVLVPARNEEHNIRTCITSLLNQDYPRYEVIVLDDESTDNTGAILQELAAQDSRLKILRGKTLPSGWRGKPYACHQLAQVAKGKYFLFTDADTVHTPESVRYLLTTFLKHDADLVTTFPYQIVKTWSERLLVSFMLRLGYFFLPFSFVCDVKKPLALACGQYLAVKAESYHKIGGHERVKDTVTEDVPLSRVYKKEGLKIIWFEGSRAVSCRMYRSFQELWQGFSRSYYDGFGSPLILLGFLYLLLAGMLGPVLFLGLWLFGKGSLLPVTVELGLLLLARWVLLDQWKEPWWLLIAHPVSILATFAIAINSWRIRQLKQVTWRGRTVS
jgi:chlorobactene glucosyltransferase